MNLLISKLTNLVSNTSNAVLLVASTTMLVSFFNWGLGLIFGAILARKVAEAAQLRNFRINYPLVGASGYVGLMIWHGGISGSAPLKVAESGHLASLMVGVGDTSIANRLPDLIPYSETIFSGFNLLLFGILFDSNSFISLSVRQEGSRQHPRIYQFIKVLSVEGKNLRGVERLDHSKIFGISIRDFDLNCILLSVFWCYNKFRNHSQSVELFYAGLGFITSRKLFELFKGLGGSYQGSKWYFNPVSIVFWYYGNYAG